MSKYLKMLEKVNYQVIITILIISLAVALILYLAYYITQIYHLQKFRKDAVIMKITPLDTCEIGSLERMLMFLHGMLLNTQWRVLTEGRPYISFEVVGRHQKIEFFLWVPKTYVRSIQEQIYISYPDCVIEEVEDHMVPLSRARKKMRELKRMIKAGEVDKTVKKLMIRGMTIKRGYNYTFPFADKVDIIPSILAAMSGLEWHEKIVLQVLLRPLDRKWQVKGRDKIKKFEKKGHKPDSKGIRIDGFTRDIMDELDLDGHDTFSPTRDLTRADRKEIREATEKILKSGYETTIRIMGIGFFGKGISTAVRSVAAAFSKLDHINRFKRRRIIFFRSLFYILAHFNFPNFFNGTPSCYYLT